MEKNGPNFYDTDSVFDTYQKHRARENNPNNTMEQPVLWNLIGDPSGLNILDLGCGDAFVAKKFKALGSLKYVGIEGSKNMYQSALKNIDPGFSEVQHQLLENFDVGESKFELVISSLALHYIDDLSNLFNKLYDLMTPGGRLIFSVEHPVITSCNESLKDTSLRQAWIVNNYFKRGKRTIKWLGDTVNKYHRTIEDFLNLLESSKFSFVKLKESDPQKKYFEDKDLWERRRKIPLFLFIEAKK